MNIADCEGNGQGGSRLIDFSDEYEINTFDLGIGHSEIIEDDFLETSEEYG